MSPSRWTHQGKKKARRRRDEPEDDGLPSVEESLQNVQDILLMVLLLQSCPSCLGSGRTPDGEEPSGIEGEPPRVRWSVCSCRRRAQGLLEEFGVAPIG